MHSIVTYATAGTAVTLASIISADGAASSNALQYRADPAISKTYALSSAAQAEEEFENYMAATLDMSEPDAGTWEEIKAKLGL